MKKIKGYDNYYIDEEGNVYKALILKNALKLPTKVFRDVRVSKSSNGSKKVTLEGKTHLIHRLVYNTFKDEEYRGEIVFIDDNKNNCSLDNLVSIDDVIEFYRKHHQ